MAGQSKFIADQPQKLVIKEKILSLSGDSFCIKTIDGRVVFWVDGGVLSPSGRKHIQDAKGNQLFDIRKKLLALHTTFFCENPQGERFFRVKRQFSMCKSSYLPSSYCINLNGDSWSVQSNWDS